VTHGQPLRIGQIGTRHGHAAGKWQALQSNPDVEAVGIWEPDPGARATAAALRTDGPFVTASATPATVFGDAHWFDSESDLLKDASVVAVAIEGRNHESLSMAQRAIEAGKHIWFDKPAGDDWPAFQQLMQAAAARQLQVQMGYMFRYSPGFAQIATWARDGLLGELFGVRAHMSTNVDLAERTEQSRHRGGILYDLGAHMLDQIVWLFGRPTSVTRVLRNDATPELPAYSDNTLAVLEFPGALGLLDIAAMETRPTARRFEVYGTRGSAIVEPFDPARTLRLALDAASGPYQAGEQIVDIPEVSRQQLYERELDAFLAVLRGERAPDRPVEHERLVQETLLRATGSI
jgi:predicted dehydrogenase